MDDIGAVLVIAIAYTDHTSYSWYCFVGVAGFGVVYFFNRIGIRSVSLYVAAGAAHLAGFLEIGNSSDSCRRGARPIDAGDIRGSQERVSSRWRMAYLNVCVMTKNQTTWTTTKRRFASLRITAQETVSPLDRLETALHPWVAFGIMPLFALANAGVRIELSAVSDPVAIAVATALVIGKPLGIVALSWLAVQAGLARLPSGVNWKTLLGAGCLAGIGFTMSLFIAGLGLEGEQLRAGKIGTLLGSALSAILGLAILWCFLRRPDTVPRNS